MTILHRDLLELISDVSRRIQVNNQRDREVQSFVDRLDCTRELLSSQDNDTYLPELISLHPDIQSAYENLHQTLQDALAILANGPNSYKYLATLNDRITSFERQYKISSRIAAANILTQPVTTSIGFTSTDEPYPSGQEKHSTTTVFNKILKVVDGLLLFPPTFTVNHPDTETRVKQLTEETQTLLRDVKVIWTSNPKESLEKIDPRVAVQLHNLLHDLESIQSGSIEAIDRALNRISSISMSQIQFNGQPEVIRWSRCFLTEDLTNMDTIYIRAHGIFPSNLKSPRLVLKNGEDCVTVHPSHQSDRMLEFQVDSQILSSFMTENGLVPANFHYHTEGHLMNTSGRQCLSFVALPQQAGELLIQNNGQTIKSTLKWNESMSVAYRGSSRITLRTNQGVEIDLLKGKVPENVSLKINHQEQKIEIKMTAPGELCETIKAKFDLKAKSLLLI